MRYKYSPDQYGRENRAVARLFLGDINKHGGEESAAIQWARLVLNKPFTPVPTEQQQNFTFAEMSQ